MAGQSSGSFLDPKRELHVEPGLQDLNILVSNGIFMWMEAKKAATLRLIVTNYYTFFIIKYSNCEHFHQRKKFLLRFHLHVLSAAIQSGADPPGPAPSTQRISGQNTLAAGSVDGAPGHRYGGHALRCPHIK